MQSGSYVLILHTHLPWVIHHGTYPHGVDWLNEAVAECYIPLLNVFNDLLNEGILPKVSIDISPVLCEQLEHPDFPAIFENYCKSKIELAQRDEKNFTDWGYHPHHIYLTKYWQNWYSERLNDFNHKYSKSIIKALKALQDIGAIEVFTCAATHGYLPLLGDDKSIECQIKLAVENYKKHFGREPRGIWLPECAYRPSYIWKTLIPVNPYHQERLRPGLEQFLARFGLNYFITDQNLLERSVPLGKFVDKEKYLADFFEKPEDSNFDFNPLRLVNVASSEKVEYGTAVAFTRHQMMSMQVWSGDIGYPAEPDYLDFHKRHLDSMLRYWRVTDRKADMLYKTLYYPEWTAKKIDLQANHFIHHLENTLNWYFNQTGIRGTLCTPFDTELFGHWWFEGPEFIRAVIKGLHFSPWVKMATCSEEIFRVDPDIIVKLPEGSWGVNNNHDVWSNPETLWTWEAIYNDEKRFNELIEIVKNRRNNELIVRIMTQALRELLLVQSSDWQFLIYTKSAKDYAEQRFFFHHSDFNRLLDLVEKLLQSNNLTKEDLSFLQECEKRNSLFPELQLDWWDFTPR
ncbi:MAG: Glycogen branching enzyme, GH-57-type, archaeal [Candidatus Kapaibacterium sp.]|nr:MAG: Glycogen branching enzyme, GH-57-type, archaeal [Candidatus Kapabacteria bacterium]